MNCEQIREQLTAYLLGDLPQETAAEIREHLEHCDGCRALVRDIEPTLDLLRNALAATSSQAPTSLSRDHRRRIRAESLKPRREKGGIIRWLTTPHGSLGRFAEVAAVLMIMFVLAGMFLPATAASRERAKRAKSIADLSQIGKAVRMYSMEHEEKLPGKMDDLKPYLGSDKVLKAPGTEKPYEYLGGGLTESASSETPIAIDKRDDGANVLYLDGSVQWHDKKELKGKSTHAGALGSFKSMIKMGEVVGGGGGKEAPPVEAVIMDTRADKLEDSKPVAMALEKETLAEPTAAAPSEEISNIPNPGQGRGLGSGTGVGDGDFAGFQMSGAKSPTVMKRSYAERIRDGEGTIGKLMSGGTAGAETAATGGEKLGIAGISSDDISIDVRESAARDQTLTEAFSTPAAPAAAPAPQSTTLSMTIAPPAEKQAEAANYRMAREMGMVKPNETVLKFKKNGRDGRAKGDALAAAAPRMLEKRQEEPKLRTDALEMPPPETQSGKISADQDGDGLSGKWGADKKAEAVKHSEAPSAPLARFDQIDDWQDNIQPHNGPMATPASPARMAERFDGLKQMDKRLNGEAEGEMLVAGKPKAPPSSNISSVNAVGFSSSVESAPRGLTIFNQKEKLVATVVGGNTYLGNEEVEPQSGAGDVGPSLAEGRDARHAASGGPTLRAKSDVAGDEEAAQSPFEDQRLHDIARVEARGAMEGSYLSALKKRQDQLTTERMLREAQTPKPKDLNAVVNGNVKELTRETGAVQPEEVQEESARPETEQDYRQQQAREGGAVPILGDIPLVGALHKKAEVDSRAKVLKKLENIKIPEIDFRQADVKDIVRVLTEATQECDVSADSEKAKGVNIVLALGTEGAAPAAPAADGTELTAEAPAAGVVTTPGVPLVTFTAHYISALQALNIATRVAGLKYRVEGDTVMVVPADAPESELITKMYDIPPDVGQKVFGGKETGDKDVKEFFSGIGVNWPTGSKIRYIPALGKLIVANTADNIATFESCISNLAASTKENKSEDKSKAEDLTGPRFKATGVNPFVKAAEQPFSTFSIGVDTASYTLMRNYMLKGSLPPAESVRTEEFVNYFDYAYAAPNRETFRVYVDVAPSKFGHGLQMMKIGVKGRRLGREEQRRAMLTFLVDTSGSMDKPDRIGLVKKSLKMLIEKMSPQDMVEIVQFDSHARLVLEFTPVSDKKKILAAIDALQCGGSTNLEEGMMKAYELAAKNFVPGGESRVLLLSDGVANLGNVAVEDILAQVATYRKQGIFCSVFGLGMGTYDDTMLQTLAAKGDGAYAFLDSEDEAKRLFVDDLAATLNTIAKDVKIQVEFNPKAVAAYRQLGYESRQLKKEDFRNDAVQAGEVGSGQSVTALYELQLAAGRVLRSEIGDIKSDDGRIATVHVRYRRTDNGKVEEIEQPVRLADVAKSFDEADVRFRLAACAAQFSEILRGSPFAQGREFKDVADVLRPVALDLNLDSQVQELLRLISAANGMPRAAMKE